MVQLIPAWQSNFQSNSSVCLGIEFIFNSFFMEIQITTGTNVTFSNCNVFLTFSFLGFVGLKVTALGSQPRGFRFES